MGILAWIFFGLIVGLVARAIMPGDQPIGWTLTTLLGIAGSLVGGLVGSLIGHSKVGSFHTSGLIGSVLGALALLYIFERVMRRRHTTTPA